MNDKYCDVLLITSVALSLTCALFLLCIYAYMIGQTQFFNRDDIFIECYNE